MSIRAVAMGMRKGILGGRPSNSMCFAVCASLQGWLSFAEGVETELVEGAIGNWSHCWLRQRDGTIIDPTADQFKKPNGKPMPKVYIGKLPDFYKTK